MAKKHISEETTYYQLNIGDIVVNKRGRIITGKGQGICLDSKWAQYSGNNVLIQMETPMGKKTEMKLSKKEIKLLLKNFQDSR